MLSAEHIAVTHIGMQTCSLLGYDSERPMHNQVLVAVKCGKQGWTLKHS